MMDLCRKAVFVGMIAAAVIFFAVPQVLAGEWQIVGPRALGMGGANVAVANDATASYWNPGAFGFFNNGDTGDYEKRGWSSQIGVGLGAQVHDNIGTDIDNITKFDFDGLSGQLQASEVSDFIQLVDDLEVFDDKENGVVSIMGNTGWRTQMGHFGFAANGFVDISVRGNLDLVNILPNTVAGAPTGSAFLDEFTTPANYSCDATCATGGGQTVLQPTERNQLSAHIDSLGWTATQRDNFINSVDNGLAQAGEPLPADIVAQLENVASTADLAASAGGGSFEANKSVLIFQGILLAEVPLTYGRAVTPNLSIGGNVKYMQARVYDTTVEVFGVDEELSDKWDQIKDKYTEESDFGLDLGMLYRVGDDFRVGLVGRNLNSPQFGRFKEKAQVRTGLAFKPTSFMILAADLDLTENQTRVGSKYKSQNVAAGVEFNFFKFLQVRGGLYKNIAENDIGLVYTAGVGLNLWLLNFDIGASLSKDKTEVDGDDIPEEARAEFALSMLF